MEYKPVTIKEIEKAMKSFSKGLNTMFIDKFTIVIVETDTMFSCNIYGKLHTGIGGFIEFTNRNSIISKIIYNDTEITEKEDMTKFINLVKEKYNALRSKEGRTP